MTTPPGQALLIIDMLGDWRFPDAEPLLAAALRIAPRIAALKARCRQDGIPALYVNDNQGRWRSDFKSMVRDGLAAGGDRARLNQLLAPEDDDYFVLKPKHSAFFATPLELLLAHLKARQLIVTGVATDQCVLATVMDARMRDLTVWCPRDCVAAQDEERQARGVAQLGEGMRVDVTEA